MIGCRACRMLRKKKSSADFNGRRICSQCRADRFPHRPAWIENPRQCRQLNADARKAIDRRRRPRLHGCSIGQADFGASMGMGTTRQERVRSAIGKGHMISDRLARRAPFIASHMAPPLPTLKNTSSDSKKFELANSRLEVGSYPELASSRLPPMFALLSAYLTTKYPGVQRVILEVDDTLRAGAKESLNG